MVGWSWSGIRLGLGVDSGSLVGHISDISVISVGGVLDVLDPDVGVNTIKYMAWQKSSSSDTSRDEVVIMNRKVVSW